MLQVVAATRAAHVDPSPPPKDEGAVPDADAAKLKALAQKLIKDNWEEVWRPIYEAFAFQKPDYV